MRATVLLFDIDGTILSSGGAGRRSIERAFEIHTGRRDACSGFNFSGMTDRAITRRGLTEVGRTATEQAIDEILETYLGELERELPRSSDYRVFAGVRETLHAVIETKNTAVGLGTGNVRLGAALKLGHAGLESHFSFGGFGCDFEARPLIIKAALERGAEQLGLMPEECRAVVIGDTPLDVDAARKNGILSLGVGTGRYKADDLAQAGASLAVADLTDAAVLPFLLGTA